MQNWKVAKNGEGRNDCLTASEDNSIMCSAVQSELYEGVKAAEEGNHKDSEKPSQWSMYGVVVPWRRKLENIWRCYPSTRCVRNIITTVTWLSQVLLEVIFWKGKLRLAEGANVIHRGTIFEVGVISSSEVPSLTSSSILLDSGPRLDIKHFEWTSGFHYWHEYYKNFVLLAVDHHQNHWWLMHSLTWLAKKVSWLS